MREGRHSTFGSGAHTVRWPFPVREVYPPLMSPDFQFSLDRILRTTRFHLQLDPPCQPVDRSKR